MCARGVCARQADGFVELVIGHMAVPLDHAQRRPAADQLDRSRRGSITQHVGRSGMSAGVVGDAGQLQQFHPAGKRHADRRCSRRDPVVAPSKDDTGLMAPLEEQSPQVCRDGHLAPLAALAIDQPREDARDMALLLDAGAEADARVRRLWETPEGQIVPIVVATIRRGGADLAIDVRVTARRSANDTSSRSPQATRPGTGCAVAMCLALLVLTLAVIVAL